MSELKAFVARMIDDGTFYPVPCVGVYLKSEADKVIRHHKYKRCLDKAKACHEKSERMYCEASTAKSLNEIIGNEPKDAVVEKFEFWGAIASTHCKRWLELAEKFKEAK